jgi:hypothetical protein
MTGGLHANSRFTSPRQIHVVPRVQHGQPRLVQQRRQQEGVRVRVQQQQAAGGEWCEEAMSAPRASPSAAGARPPRVHVCCHVCARTTHTTEASRTMVTDATVEEVMNPHPVLLQSSMPIK